MPCWILWTYRLISVCLLPLALIKLAWRAWKDPSYRPYWYERIGLGKPSANAWRNASQRIWIHAVSLGETRAIAPLIKTLSERYPNAHFLMTHTTPNGRKTSEALLLPLLASRLSIRYLPYDTPFITPAFIRHWQPTLCLLVETELWPHLILGTKQYNVPCLLINARLSKRSSRRYAHLGKLSKGMISALTGILYQDRATQRRFEQLGAAKHPSTHFKILGNIKFNPIAMTDQQKELGAQLREAWNKPALRLALASSRPGEEALFLDTLRHYLEHNASTETNGLSPLAISIIPRHIERAEEIALLATRLGWTVQRKSTWLGECLDPKHTLLLGDTTGELLAYYHANDIALLGGSWGDYGAHNPLEALASQCVLIVGSSRYNFHQIIRSAHLAHALISANNMDIAFEHIHKLRQNMAALSGYQQAGMAFCHQQEDILAKYVQALEPWLDSHTTT